MSEMKAPLFSILHTSARPDKWRAVYDDWMSKAVHPDNVEYVLCVDPRWGFSADPQAWLPSQIGGLPHDNLHVIQNTGRRCYVDGVNIAGKASTGQVLIVNADDQFACQDWDQRLHEQFFDYRDNTEFVIECDEGGNEHARGIMPMPILSRARYEAQGYVFYPEYESMFADNDFCAAARQDGVVIDARHLMFPHRHAMFDGNGEWKREDWTKTLDAAYLAQNRSEAFAIGQEVFKRRKASGFPPMQHGIVQRTIALCLSGERFEGVWVDALLTLYGHLIEIGRAHV